MTKNRYAQILGGVVIYIYETHLPYNKLWEIFDATHSDFFDITNRPEVQLGWRMGYNENGEWDLVAPPQPETLEDKKAIKLEEVLLWTSNAITGGFTSFASGESRYYDSKLEDQNSYYVAYMATQSPDFLTHPIYQGTVPVRCRMVKETPFDEKVVVHLNKEQFQQLIDDLAVHVATCKAKGWELQERVSNANSGEELDSIVWE